MFRLPTWWPPIPSRRTQQEVQIRVSGVPRGNSIHSKKGTALDVQTLSSPVLEPEGGTYSHVACIRRLTIQHAFFPRRGTILTSSRDTSNLLALTMFPYITQSLSHISLSSCFAVCGHDVSRTIAIVCFLRHRASNDVPPLLATRHSPPSTSHRGALPFFYDTGRVLPLGHLVTRPEVTSL